MTIGRICSRHTYLADPDETALEAADRMRRENVGTLVVIDGRKKPIGILTDRDLAVRVLAPGKSPRDTKVGDVMTANPRTVSEKTPIEDAVGTMRSLAVRRLPVVDGRGKLAGIVSVDDVLELVTEELGNLGRIIGWSRPGVTVPTVRAARGKKAPELAGARRASSDLEC